MIDLNFYDMDGKPISMFEWGTLLQDDARRRVASTDGPGWHVSTVLLGMNHRHGPDPGPPLIFETMVFAHDYPDIHHHTERYATKEEAQEGHENVVSLVLAAVQRKQGPE